MAALDFPSSPALNQLFAAGNGVTYKWNGTNWVTVSTSSSWLLLTGGTLTGALIIDMPTSGSNIIVGSFADDPSYNAISLNGDATGAGMAGLLGGGASGDLYIATPTGHAMTFRVGGVDRAILNNTVFQMNNGTVIASGGDILAYRYGTNATAIIRATSVSDDAYAPPFLSMWRTSGSNTAAPGGSTLGSLRFEGLGSDNGYAYWGGLSGDMIGANAVNGGVSDLQMWANLGGNAVAMMRWSGASQNIQAYYPLVADRFTTTAANINAQTGTSYALVAADNGKTVTMNNAAASSLTVPTGLPAGFGCTVVQLGVGQVTISGTATLRNRNGLKLAGQYAASGLIYVTTDTYTVGGDTVP